MLVDGDDRIAATAHRDAWAGLVAVAPRHRGIGLGVYVNATVIETAKLSGSNPAAYLADILGRISDPPNLKLDELLPWNWISSLHEPAA